MFQIEFDTKQIEGALPDYKYIKRLGSGAFAVVHLVENRESGEQFALKKINCFGITQYDKTGAVNQVRILSSLQHKNIIKVKSCLFDNNEDVMYTFMQYAESGDLSTLIQQAKQKKKRIPQSTVWKIISDVSQGLNYLHRNQIIHRDIKPANIFRMGKNFKIGDMNVSKIIKNGVAASTKTGSPLYTAPEVWNSEQYSYQCDIWSLGALAYQLCCLKVPFEADTIIQLIKKVKQQKPRSLPTFYSSSLDDIIKKMLQNSPTKRISSQQIMKIASSKLKQQTQGLQDGQIDYLMDTIVFPDTHQRWVNLLPPSTLPPKTSRKQVNKSQVQQAGRSTSKEKNQQIQLMIVSRNNGFKSNQKKPTQIHSKSRGKPEPKNELKPPTSNLPPIYRSNSPMCQKKKPSEKSQKSVQRRQNLSNSRNKRQSAIQLVIQSKSMINNVQN